MTADPLEEPPMQAYLLAKRSIDDRAMDRRVLQRFGAELSAAGGRGPVRIAELGAGVGTMLPRLIDWRSLPARVAYRLIDDDPDSLAVARERLPGWLEEAGYEIEEGKGSADLLARRGNDRLEIGFEVDDAFPFNPDWRADAVVAAAVLDVVDLEGALSSIRERCREGGLLYAPITFDGATGFAPAHPLDDRIERLYHRHMDEIREAGSSRAGRDLLAALPESGWDVLAAGGSDWIVLPRGDGYREDEDVFLAALLGTIEGALAEYPADVLDPADRRDWIETRRRQLAEASLVAVCHHLDLLARR